MSPHSPKNEPPGLRTADKCPSGLDPLSFPASGPLSLSLPLSPHCAPSCCLPGVEQHRHTQAPLPGTWLGVWDLWNFTSHSRHTHDPNNCQALLNISWPISFHPSKLTAPQADPSFLSTGSLPPLLANASLVAGKKTRQLFRHVPVFRQNLTKIVQQRYFFSSYTRQLYDFFHDIDPVGTFF